VSLAAEHSQQVVGADLVGDQRPGHAQHVRPCMVIRFRFTRLRATAFSDS
jgi:hypothetical protein